MTKKKVAETTLEMGKKGNSGVTAKGIWLGVDKGESLDFSHFLLVPVRLSPLLHTTRRLTCCVQADALSIARGRYLEISYAVKISVQASLSADVSVEIPIKVVSFISIDPPPGHCADPTPTNTPRAGHGRTKFWNIDQLRDPPVVATPIQEHKQPLTIADLVDRPSPKLTRMGSLDTIRTSNISQSSHLDIRSPDLVRRGGLGGGEQKLQHRMSLECIGEAIASATARGHRRTASGLRSQIDFQLEDHGVEGEGEGQERFYAGSGVRSYSPGGSPRDSYERETMDDAEEVESEDELDAVMRQARFDEEEDESTPFDTSVDLMNRLPTSPLRPLTSSAFSMSPSDTPTSPTKSTPDILKKSPSKPRSESFGYATPGSPIKPSSPTKVKSPVKATIPLPPTPTIRRAVSRVELRAPTPTSTPGQPLPNRPIVAKVSMSSLSIVAATTTSPTKKTLEKKPSMKSLRPTSSMANLKTRPTSSMSMHSPASTSSSSRRTPELDSDSPSSFARLTPSTTSANIARHTRGTSYTDKTTSSSLHALPPLPLRRKPTESILPSVRNKVRALENRQDALLQLRRVDQSDLAAREAEGLRRADSVRTEMSFAIGDDLTRNGSLMSFKAPLLRRHGD